MKLSPPLRSLCSVWSLLLILALNCCIHAVDGASYPAFTLVPNDPALVRFTPRQGAFSFEWYGRQWVAGGYGVGSDGFRDYLDDVWSSYDEGRNWTLTSTLPTNCGAATVSPVVYAQSLYLVCGENTGTDQFHRATYASSDPQLATASWAFVSPSGDMDNDDDGLEYRKDFNVQHMAVPFDGVGTLILTNGFDTVNKVPVNDVWWLSATDRFQPGSVNPGTQWHQFTVGGAVYHAPWPARSQASTVVDAEGLVMVMTSGQTAPAGKAPNLTPAVFANDVWRMSWLNGRTAPAVYQLAAAAGWTARAQATMWQVSDSLFFYGGNGGPAFSLFDDLYQSMNYGNSWYLVSSTTTDGARNLAAPLVVSRRFFLVGGNTAATAAANAAQTSNEVWEAYW